ncbi:MAG: nuclear transport factor 2 family protein [Candidatus Nanopelagicales bacterium]
MAEDLEESLRAAERRLQAAQLGADADALDALLDDRLIYTGGPDGGRYSKDDDLAIQRSGRQRLSRVDEEDLVVLVDGSTGVTWFRGTLAGTFDGAEFSARLHFTRTWIHSPASGWRVVAAHASPVP